MKPIGYDTHYMNAISRLKKAEKIAEKMHANIYLGFSGGKDSQVIYHLAESILVPFIPHHFLTTIEPPELIHFIRNYYPNVKIIRQPLSFGQLIVKKKTLPTRHKRYCCNYYKELKYPNSVVLTGIRHEESLKRAQRKDFELGTATKSRRQGFSIEDAKEEVTDNLISCVRGSDQILINPITDWTEKDVLYYLKEVLGVPMCPLYKEGFKRMGCIICPMTSYKDRVKDVIRYPKYKQMYIRTIHRLRENSNFLADHPELSDEQVFDWWISGDSLKKWIADNITQGFLF